MKTYTTSTGEVNYKIKPMTCGCVGNCTCNPECVWPPFTCPNCPYPKDILMKSKPKPKKKIKKVKPSDFKSGITVDLYRIGYHDGMEDGFRLGQLLNKKVK